MLTTNLISGINAVIWVCGKEKRWCILLILQEEIYIERYKIAILI